MELTDYRSRLDEIDGEILRLFSERMDIVSRIALWKQEKNLPVMDLRREQEKLRCVKAQSPEDLAEYSTRLFSFLMELSRQRQNSILHREKEGTATAADAWKNTSECFPENAAAACRDAEDA